MAYRVPLQGAPLEFLGIDFYQVGSHENFYDDLKNYLRQESRKGTTP